MMYLKNTCTNLDNAKAVDDTIDRPAYLVCVTASVGQTSNVAEPSILCPPIYNADI